jgi:hypothetical protein
MLFVFAHSDFLWIVLFCIAPSVFSTKTGRHDITEILLKVALKHKKINHFFTLTSNLTPMVIFLPSDLTH